MTGWVSTRRRPDAVRRRAYCTRADGWTTSTTAVRTPATLGRKTVPVDPGEAFTRAPVTSQASLRARPVADTIRRAVWRMRRWLHG